MDENGYAFGTTTKKKIGHMVEWDSNIEVGHDEVFEPREDGKK